MAGRRLHNVRIRQMSSIERISLSPMIHQTVAGRSRFYKQVHIEPVESEPTQGYRILLDSRVLKTPARAPLHLPTMELAMAIAAEWDAQIDKSRGIQPSTMPLMTLASTAIDQVSMDSAPVKKTVLSYLPTDTALFFTTAEDRILQKKQKQHFQPTVRWLKRSFDIECKTTESFAGRIQHDEREARKMRILVDAISADPFALTCLQCATMECKSIVLALAFLCRHLTLDQARAASRLEEECQIEWWGAVEGGHDMDRLNNSVSLSSVGVFMGLLYSAEQHSILTDKWRSSVLESGVK